jgi:hypothetical protein
MELASNSTDKAACVAGKESSEGALVKEVPPSTSPIAARTMQAVESELSQEATESVYTTGLDNGTAIDSARESDDETASQETSPKN